jgi:hypothetical protein
LVVAESAAEIDLDAFGTDFGDGVPVAAFQIKKADSDWCTAYAIYSLQKPPHLLRTITGGEFFSASDENLDGTVEVFTNDAAAVDGFDKLTLGEMDSPPTVVLRLANAHLQDVSAEFQPYFDAQIRSVRATMDAHDLEDFRNSDGALAATAETSLEELHHLRTVKIKVLEIVWAYLYCGREQEAWRSLAEMWSPADVNRIRAALSRARASGIQRQVDSTSTGSHARNKRHAHVFNAVDRSGLMSSALEVVPPEAILLQRPPVSQQEPELILELVVDRAGKVRSAEPVGNAKRADPQLITAARSWKFIPALKNGQAVASRVRVAVSPQQ